MTTIILGGGIIGLSTAYYLAKSSPAKQAAIKILDPAPRLLASASGFAGGFLAPDWFSPGVAPLGALSFDLHRQLADQNQGRRRWGYAKSTALSLSIDEVGARSAKDKKGNEQDWLLRGGSRREVARGVNNGETSRPDQDEPLNPDGSPKWAKGQVGGSVERISPQGGCAQVEPLKLGEFLREEAESNGVEILLGSKTVGVVRDQNGLVTGVKVRSADGADVEVACANIVIAAGAWTPKVYRDLFPESKLHIPIEPLAGHSCTVRSRHLKHHHNPLTKPEKFDEKGDLISEPDSSFHAIFSAPGPNWRSFAPEAISRIGQDGEAEVYVGGLNSSTMPLPELATESQVDEASRMELRRVTGKLMGEDQLDVVREAVCFRPVVAWGTGPIIGRVREVKVKGDHGAEGGVFVASGHGPWGISLSLGTGLVVSEMLQGKKTSADVSALGRALR